MESHRGADGSTMEATYQEHVEAYAKEMLQREAHDAAHYEATHRPEFSNAAANGPGPEPSQTEMDVKSESHRCGDDDVADGADAATLLVSSGGR